MRFTLRLLGAEVFHFDTDPEPPPEKDRDLSGGTTSSYPVSMTGRYGDKAEPWYEEDE